MHGARTQGRRLVAIGSLVTVTLGTLLTIGAPMAFADIGSPDLDPGDTIEGAVSDPIDTIEGAVTDPVGTVESAVSDPVGTVTGSVDTVSDTVRTAGDAVSGATDSVATSAGLVDPGRSSGTSSETTASDANTGAQSTRAGATSGGSGSTTAMRRDVRAPSSEDTVDVMTTADVARPDVRSGTRCAVGTGFLCSLNDLMGLGSLVDAVTAVIRSLALTGLTLLPWLAATTALAAIGLSVLRMTRPRSTRTASMHATADPWVYPGVVR
jgi:hypothetical protein